ncbi:uncharacterized protein LOC109598620 [Aethina tumida]|uniref:uncharacterized protein LOC109598620 n=1 Tax=Aethina tumida TaxID=116153 RepID=UPI00096B569B|nr:uncharacterized protein LOC109598620 [Aethina tumida]
MMTRSAIIVLALAIFGGIEAVPTDLTTPVPTAVHQPQDPAATFVPHQTYPYADTYGGYLYPVAYQPQNDGYMNALVPAAQGALQVALRVFAKVGLFLMGGLTLLVIGGLFTTAVCSLTPLCTISFMGLGGLDKDSMRSFMTPDRISAAAALIQDAIGKYQRLQRATGN